MFDKAQSIQSLNYLSGAEADAGLDFRVPRFRFREDPPIIFAMFLVFVCAKYMQWGDRREFFATIRFEFVLGLALILACVHLIVSAPHPLRGGRLVLIGATVLVFVMILQLPFAADPIRAKSIFNDRVVKSAFMTFFMAILIRSPRYLRWFMTVFLFSCFYITQESVRGLISGGLVWENQGIMRLHGTVSLYGHPNSLAGLAMGCVPFCVFLMPVLRSRLAKLGLLALLGTSLTCVVFSGSRTSYVALGFFLLFWLLTSRRKLLWIITAIIVGFIALNVLPRQYIDRFQSIGEVHSSSGGSNQTRILILKDAWQILLDHPFGVGVASFPAMRQLVFGRSQDTHNLYLEIATNLGFHGLLAFLFFIYALFLVFWRVHRRAKAVRALLRGRFPTHLIYRHLADLDFVLSVTKATACFIYVRLALGLFGMDLYEVYWWFAAGIAIGIANIMTAIVRQATLMTQITGPMPM